MEKNNKRTLIKLFNDYHFAIGDSDILLASYMDYLLGNNKINDIKFRFSNSNKENKNILDIANIFIEDENKDKYCFSINTYGISKNIIDKGNVRFAFTFKKFNENFELLKLINVESGSQFENTGIMEFFNDNSIIKCKSNENCSWNNLYSLVDLYVYENDTINNLPLFECKTTIKLDGKSLNERLTDLDDQVQNLQRSNVKIKR